MMEFILLLSVIVLLIALIRNEIRNTGWIVREEKKRNG